MRFLNELSCLLLFSKLFGTFDLCKPGDMSDLKFWTNFLMNCGQIQLSFIYFCYLLFVFKIGYKFTVLYTGLFCKQTLLHHKLTF